MRILEALNEYDYDKVTAIILEDFVWSTLHWLTLAYIEIKSSKYVAAGVCIRKAISGMDCTEIIDALQTLSEHIEEEDQVIIQDILSGLEEKI